MVEGLAAVHRDLIFSNGDLRRPQVDFVLEGGELHVEAVDTVLSIGADVQHVGDFGEGKLVVHGQVLAFDVGSGTQRRDLGLVVRLEVGLSTDVELGLSVEGLQHGHQRVDIRNHMQQVINLHIQQMEVHSQEQVVLAWRLVHGRELHLGGFVGETDLLQDERAVLHRGGAFQVVEVEIAGDGPLGVKDKAEVDAFRDHKGIVLLVLFRFGRLDVGPSQAVGEVHDLIEVEVVGAELHLTLHQVLMVFDPLLDADHATLQAEVGLPDT